MSDLAGLRAVGYCRVSTDDKGQTNVTQEREIRNYCDKHGIKLERIFADEMTGTTLARPSFMELVGYIKLESIPLLIAYDVSRLTRNEDLDKIRALIQPCVIRYVNMDIDTDSVGGRVTTAVREIFDKEENLIRAEKTKLGMQTRKLAGRHVGRPCAFMFTDELDNAPVGLCANDSVHKTSTKVYTIEYILSLADSGLSIGTVAKRVINVNPMALRRALIRVGRLEDYKTRFNNARR